MFNKYSGSRMSFLPYKHRDGRVALTSCSTFLISCSFKDTKSFTRKTCNRSGKHIVVIGDTLGASELLLRHQAQNAKAERAKTQTDKWRQKFSRQVILLGTNPSCLNYHKDVCQESTSTSYLSLPHPIALYLVVVFQCGH